jgi:23S rRNA (uracil1939-C5)-methyltransferase
VPRPRADAGRAEGGLAEVLVERLGAAGDGVATFAGAPLFVRLAAPGERWRVRLGPATRAGRRAEPLRRLAGPPRAEPACPQFGRCGGCALQHLAEPAYLAFKLARIETALARAGLRPGSLLPPARSPAGSRRRLRLGFARHGSGLRLGFRAHREHALVAAARCPVARPELERLLGPLGEALARVPLVHRSGVGEVLLTLTSSGVDLLLRAAAEPDLEDRERLAALAEALDLARLALGLPDGPAEPVVVRRRPLLDLAGIAVEPPPGAFLQPTVEGERALQAAAARWVPERARLLDLYAGLGALSLPLLPRLARLELVEGDPAQAAAAARALAARPEARVVRRDLARDPLAPAELAAFDAVLLDPPRAGAVVQCAALAAAPIGRVVYASCEPASFARDARLLVEAGFALTALQPVDQFLWSAEVELVALLERPGAPPAAA